MECFGSVIQHKVFPGFYFGEDLKVSVGIKVAVFALRRPTQEFFGDMMRKAVHHLSDNPGIEFLHVL